MSGRVELHACETCGGNDRDAEGRTQGQRLIHALREVSAESGQSHLQLEPVRCLWACKRSCAVHIRGEGRVGYVLCELPPTKSSAEALLKYTQLYAESSDGAVPFRQWPDALRGHFLCRTPKASVPPSPREADQEDR